MRGRKRWTPLSEDKDLPSELWREIFARLPAKTLLRFRCVCKTWCSYIDSPDFISMHLKLYPNNSTKSYIIVNETVPKTFTDFKFTIRRSDTFRKCSELGNQLNSNMVFESIMIDGLLLMTSNSNSYTVSRGLWLWNPSIRKSLLLPPCPSTGKFYNRRYHLGFAPLSNDYKVVAFELVDPMVLELVDYTMPMELSIAIYSLRDHLWRVKPKMTNVSTWCLEAIRLKNGGVFFQGAVYWRPYSRSIPGEEARILCFDFDAEEFSYVELPDLEEEMIRFLFLFHGSLAIFGISRLRSCIWVMEKNGGKNLWHQCFWGNSNLDSYTFIKDEMYEPTHVLYLESTGTLLVRSCNRLTSYNIISHKIQRVAKSVRCLYVGAYVESLVLHKEYEGTTWPLLE